MSLGWNCFRDKNVMFSLEASSWSLQCISKYCFYFFLSFLGAVRTCRNASKKKGLEKAIGLDHYLVQLWTSCSTYPETLERVWTGPGVGVRWIPTPRVVQVWKEDRLRLKSLQPQVTELEPGSEQLQPAWALLRYLHAKSDWWIQNAGCRLHVGLCSGAGWKVLKQSDSRSF